MDYKSWPVVVLVAVVAVLLLVWLHAWYWERRLRISLEYALTERLATPDGAFIELRRLPAPERPAALPPVLLVHGLGANHRNHDLQEDLSLARFLRGRGRDVWLLTLRSGVPLGWFWRAWRVHFAAMVRHDLPLALREVLAKTGAEQIDYVGFSMGGMLLYAAIGRSLPPERIRRIGIIGSPAIVRLPVKLRVPSFVGQIPKVFFPTLRLRLAARVGAFAAEWLRTPAHHWVLNPENVAPGVARASMVNMVADVPGPLNRDFAEWAAAPGGVITIEGEAVLDGLGEIGVPCLFFAGSADRLAPPDAVKAAFSAWGARREGIEKRFVLLGRAAGASADYGHGDLAVGARASEEVFEPLCVFLGEPGDGSR